MGRLKETSEAMDSKLDSEERPFRSDDLLAVHMDGYYKGYDHGMSDAKARIAELEAALSLFIEADDGRWRPNYADEDEIDLWVKIGDLRAARAALGEKE